jgi:hypothetical protein
MGKINTKRKMMNKKIVFPILILLATLAVIAFNGLAVNLPLNGIDTGEISDMFDVYFVPAGYVFSIWGLIYLALLPRERTRRYSASRYSTSSAASPI